MIFIALYLQGNPLLRFEQPVQKEDMLPLLIISFIGGIFFGLVIGIFFGILLNKIWSYFEFGTPTLTTIMAILSGCITIILLYYKRQRQYMFLK